MKYCMSCGKQFEDSAQFCPYCGARQSAQPAAPVPYAAPQISPDKTIKDYAIEQRRFNEKVFGRGTRSIDSVEGLLNHYASQGWRLHTMMTAPTRDEKTQLTTMVFERDIPAPSR